MTDVKATDVLLEAADLIQARADQRDHPDGERSIPRAVEMFGALTGHRLTDRDGWILMALLKLSRSQGGKFHLDDYIDAAAYIALAAEAEAAAQPTTLADLIQRRIVPDADLHGLNVAGRTD